MELEDLKKQFIIDPEEFNKEQLPKLVERVLKHCRLDKNGRIQILNRNCFQSNLSIIVKTFT